MLTKGNSIHVKRAAAACCVLLMLSGCSLLPKEEEQLKPPLIKPVQENFELYEVKTGSITKTFTAVGSFVSSETTNYSFKESGLRLEALFVKPGDTVQAGDVIAQLVKGDLETRIELEKLNLEKAQLASLETLQNDPNNTNALRLKMIDVEVAKVQLKSLQEQLAKTRLVAEKPGVITYLSDIRQGDSVEAYNTIATIANPEQVQLVYEAANGSDLAGIQVGMEAQVKIVSKNINAKGKVLQTPSSAPATLNKEQADRSAKTLIVALEAQDMEGIAIGNYGDLSIIVEKRDNVLLIPSAGLRTYLNRDYVQVLEGESRKEVDVEKGLVTPTEVEIRKGLKEGQKIILNN